MLWSSDLTRPSDWRLEVRKKSEMWDWEIERLLSLSYEYCTSSGPKISDSSLCGGIIKSPGKCWIHLTDCILCYDRPVTSLPTPAHHFNNKNRILCLLGLYHGQSRQSSSWTFLLKTLLIISYSKILSPLCKIVRIINPVQWSQNRIIEKLPWNGYLKILGRNYFTITIFI